MVTTVCSQRSALLPAQKYASCGGGPLTAVLSIPCAVTKMTRIANNYFTRVTALPVITDVIAS